MVGVAEAGSDPQAEEIGRGEDRVVQHVDIGAKRFPESQRELATVLNGGNLGQMRLERLQALGFDRGLIHKCVVEVGDFARVGARGGAGLRSFFDDGGGLLAAEVVEDAKKRRCRRDPAGISVRSIQAPLA